MRGTAYALQLRWRVLTDNARASGGTSQSYPMTFGFFSINSDLTQTLILRLSIRPRHRTKPPSDSHDISWGLQVILSIPRTIITSHRIAQPYPSDASTPQHGAVHYQALTLILQRIRRSGIASHFKRSSTLRKVAWRWAGSSTALHC